MTTIHCGRFAQVRCNEGRNSNRSHCSPCRPDKPQQQDGGDEIIQALLKALMAALQGKEDGEDGRGCKKCDKQDQDDGKNDIIRMLLQIIMKLLGKDDKGCGNRQQGFGTHFAGNNGGGQTGFMVASLRISA